MIVEPDLAQGSGTRIGQTLKQGRFHSGIPLARDMRMNSTCDAHARYGRLGTPAQIACAFIDSRRLQQRRRLGSLARMLLAGGMSLRFERLALGRHIATRGLEYLGQQAQCLGAPDAQFAIRAFAFIALGRVAHRAYEIDAHHGATRKRQRRMRQHGKMRMRVGNGRLKGRRRRAHISPPLFAMLAKQRITEQQIPRVAIGVDIEILLNHCQHPNFIRRNAIEQANCSVVYSRCTGKARSGLGNNGRRRCLRFSRVG